MQVDALYCRHGQGSQLLRCLEDFAWRTSMRKVVLTVFKNNTDARTFYTKCGYSFDATSPSDDPSDLYRAVILRKVNPAWRL